jgi:hypothetical protein
VVTRSLVLLGMAGKLVKRQAVFLTVESVRNLSLALNGMARPHVKKLDVCSFPRGAGVQKPTATSPTFSRQIDGREAFSWS